MSYSVDQGAGNVLALQLKLKPEYYQTAAALEAAYAKMLDQARAEGWIDPSGKTVVLLPEMVGMYFMLVGETDPKLFDVSAFKDVNAALTYLIKRRWLQILTTSSPEPVWNVQAAALRRLFNLKGQAMADAYQATFSSLARKYGVTIIGGSIPLPEPKVNASGAIRVDLKGPMRNVMGVFHPNGAIDPKLVLKAYPPSYEYAQLKIQRSPVEIFPSFETPVGRIGALICADSWFPKAYERFKDLAVDYVLVAAHDATPKKFTKTWSGYSLSPGFGQPEDVLASDPGSLLEGEAWIKYAMPGRISSSGAIAGVTVWTHETMWGSDVIEVDSPFVWEKGQDLTQGFGSAKPEITNYYLPPRQ